MNKKIPFLIGLIIIILFLLIIGVIIFWNYFNTQEEKDPSFIKEPEEQDMTWKENLPENIVENVQSWVGGREGISPVLWNNIGDLTGNGEKELVMSWREGAKDYVELYVFSWSNDFPELIWTEKVSIEDAYRSAYKIAIGDTDHNGLKEVNFIYTIKSNEYKMLTFEWDGENFFLKREVTFPGVPVMSSSPLVSIGNIIWDEKIEIITMIEADIEKTGFCHSAYFLILSWNGEEFVAVQKGRELINDCIVDLQIGDTNNEGYNKIILTSAYETDISGYVLFEFGVKDYIKKQTINSPKTSDGYYRYNWVWIGDYTGDGKNEIIALQDERRRLQEDKNPLYVLLKWDENEQNYLKIDTITRDLKCEESSNYFVIIEQTDQPAVKNFLIKAKRDSDQIIACDYVVEEEDFELKNQGFVTFLAITDNFLVLDIGTGPYPRGLVVYDLSLQEKVYSDSYSGLPPGSMIFSNENIKYWSPIEEEATIDNCPEINEFLSHGLGAGIEAYVSLDLLDLTKKELGEYRCSSRQ